jgi:hypothetical protein
VITVTVDGFVVPVFGKTTAIFDTSIAIIIGDTTSVQMLYYQLYDFGAREVHNDRLDGSIYTST